MAVRWKRWLWITLVGAGLMSAPTVHSAPLATLTIYADALDSGWANWSWDTTVNLNNTTPVRAGNRSIAVTYTAGWAGLYLHAAPAINLSAYQTLRFWAHGGASGTRAIKIVANGDGAHERPLSVPANTWTQFDVALSALGSPTTLSDLYWQDNSDGAQPTFYLDEVQLIGSGPEPGTTIALNIDAQADVHPISPDIYGINYADEALAAELNLPVRRWGGNSTSRYNWQSDLSNTGSDWYFENIPQGGNANTLPNGSAADLFVEQDRRTGTKTILTMPLIGWVAKSDSPRDHPYACGFKVSVYGPQIAPNAWTAAVDPWDTDCGSGVVAGGNFITTNNPLDTSMAIGPAFVAQWVSHLIGRYGTAANGGVKFYNLDNEPMLWNSTHRDVHPTPTTYDELRDKTVQVAAAIKAADPSALTLGPVLWGWCAYFFSARDGCAAGLDYSAHNNTHFVPWYLQQLAAYQQQHGTRLLDYLDLHYYPQAQGVALSDAGNAATQALRLRSTRALWDASYMDESWISDGGGVAVQLIPRMQAWVAAQYPGTKLAMTEYNWGALDDINGALAQVDVLGIFGRQGLDLATLWSPPASTEPGAFAFRLYRNFDGQHHTFGETSVRAISADQDRLAIYAARRGADNALTLMVINKSPTAALTGTVSLAGFDPAAVAPVYRYSAANLTAIVRVSDQAIGPGGFTAVFPPSSITLAIIPPGVPLTPRVWLPVVFVQ